MKTVYFGRVLIAEDGRVTLLDKNLALDKFAEPGIYNAVIALEKTATASTMTTAELFERLGAEKDKAEEIIVPLWMDARKAYLEGQPTPLERFVYENEPRNKPQAKAFRNFLELLFSYLAQTG